MICHTHIKGVSHHYALYITSSIYRPTRNYAPHIEMAILEVSKQSSTPWVAPLFKAALLMETSNSYD